MEVNKVGEFNRKSEIQNGLNFDTQKTKREEQLECKPPTILAGNFST